MSNSDAFLWAVLILVLIPIEIIFSPLIVAYWITKRLIRAIQNCDPYDVASKVLS